MSSPRSFWPLAKLTCVEIPRQPALLLLTTTLVLFIGCLPFLITHNLGEAGKLVRDSSLAMMFLGSLLLAVPSACNAVSSEIRSGTAGAILSKPVGRIQFLAAKFVGVSLVMLTFSGMAMLAILLADRAAAREFQVGWRFLIPLYIAIVAAYVVAGIINYVTRRPFPSTAFWCLALFLLIAFLYTLTLNGGEAVSVVDHGGHTHEVTNPIEEVPVRWAILPAAALLTMAAMMIQALALLCALRLAVVPSLSVCGGLFMAGLMSDYLLAERAAEALWAKALYMILPNWQHFWMADALTAGGSIPWSYVGQAAVYAGGWTLGVLLIALGSFDRMEVR
jgi:ABC-type transport system involved in multi-copper enzyme maturation permease subunit